MLGGQISTFLAACVVPGLQTIGAYATEQKPISAGGRGGAASKSPLTDDFAKFVNETLSEWHVAGAAIGVIDGDDVFTEGYGYATLPDVPATPETLWYAGSTTKAHILAALGQLIDSNKYPALSRGWKTPISSIIRDDFVLQDDWATAHITLEDAASHRTGFGDHDMSWVYDSNNTQHAIRDTVRNMRNFPMAYEPRVEVSYCNFMFVVLTHVIECLTERRLEDVLRDSIWNPLEMESTYFDLQDAKDAPEHLSTGYYWNKEEEKMKPVPFAPTEPISGAGAIISNVYDYTKWVKCLLRKSEPLSEAVHQEMRTPRTIFSPEPALGADVTLYSLGWFRTTVYGQVAYWHSGSVVSHGALVYWFPDLDYGVVLFANFASSVRQIIMMRLIEHKLQIPENKRYNMSKKLKEAESAFERDLSNATNILFPNRPETPLPPSVKISDLVGSYHNEGYGLLELRKEPNPSNSRETILVGDRNNFVWRHELRLHHVTGDFWTVYLVMPDGPLGMTTFFGGQFTLGVDGKVAGLATKLPGASRGVDLGTLFWDKIT